MIRNYQYLIFSDCNTPLLWKIFFDVLLACPTPSTLILTQTLTHTLTPQNTVLTPGSCLCSRCVASARPTPGRYQTGWVRINLSNTGIPSSSHNAVPPPGGSTMLHTPEDRLVPPRAAEGSTLLEEALEEEGATIPFLCLDLPLGDGGSSRVGFPPGGVAAACDCMFIDGTTGLADAVDGGGSGESASELAK